MNLSYNKPCVRVPILVILQNANYWKSQFAYRQKLYRFIDNALSYNKRYVKVSILGCRSILQIANHWKSKLSPNCYIFKNKFTALSPYSFSRWNKVEQSLFHNEG